MTDLTVVMTPEFMEALDERVSLLLGAPSETYKVTLTDLKMVGVDTAEEGDVTVKIVAAGEVE